MPTVYLSQTLFGSVCILWYNVLWRSDLQKVWLTNEVGNEHILSLCVKCNKHDTFYWQTTGAVRAMSYAPGITLYALGNFRVGCPYLKPSSPFWKIWSWSGSCSWCGFVLILYLCLCHRLAWSLSWSWSWFWYWSGFGLGAPHSPLWSWAGSWCGIDLGLGMVFVLVIWSWTGYWAGSGSQHLFLSWSRCWLWSLFSLGFGLGLGLRL